ENVERRVRRRQRLAFEAIDKQIGHRHEPSASKPRLGEPEERRDEEGLEADPQSADPLPVNFAGDENGAGGVGTVAEVKEELEDPPERAAAEVKVRFLPHPARHDDADGENRHEEPGKNREIDDVQAPDHSANLRIGAANLHDNSANARQIVASDLICLSSSNCSI